MHIFFIAFPSVSLFCCYFDIWKTILGGGGQQMVAAAVFLLSRPDEMVSWKTIISPPPPQPFPVREDIPRVSMPLLFFWYQVKYVKQMFLLDRIWKKVIVYLYKLRFWMVVQKAAAMFMYDLRILRIRIRNTVYITMSGWFFHDLILQDDVLGFFLE